MCCKRGKKKMNATAPKVYSLFDFSTKKNKKHISKLSKLSSKDIKQSMEFRRKSRDRD